MIPVRVPAGLKPTLANGRRFPAADGWCPVCDETLAEGPVVLVFCGIAPADRREGENRWTNGGAVAVHAVCAGVPDEETGA
jgi:hypothetical protein